jgi:hypothetical protein
VRVSLRPPPTFNHSQQCLIEMHVSLIVIDSEINFALEQNCVQLNFVLRAGVHIEVDSVLSDEWMLCKSATIKLFVHK